MSFTGFIDLRDTDINALNFEKKEDYGVFCQGYIFKFKVQFIGVFRTQSNIYVGAF